MEKVTKKDLNERLLMLETLLGLHRVLPDGISNEQANNAIFRMQCALSSGKELAERESKLKVIDQSVFDHQPDDKRFFAIDADGQGWFYRNRPVINADDKRWMEPNYSPSRAGFDYNPTFWKDSLIERDKVELTGSDLCRAMLARGDKHIMCFVGDLSESSAIKRGLARIVTGIHKDRFETNNTAWSVAIPINSQGETLTQSDVGL